MYIVIDMSVYKPSKWCLICLPKIPGNFLVSPTFNDPKKKLIGFVPVTNHCTYRKLIGIDWDSPKP